MGYAIKYFFKRVLFAVLVWLARHWCTLRGGRLLIISVYFLPANLAQKIQKNFILPLIQLPNITRKKFAHHNWLLAPLGLALLGLAKHAFADPQMQNHNNFDNPPPEKIDNDLAGETAPTETDDSQYVRLHPFNHNENRLLEYTPPVFNQYVYSNRLNEFYDENTNQNYVSPTITQPIIEPNISTNNADELYARTLVRFNKYYLLITGHGTLDITDLPTINQAYQSVTIDSDILLVILPDQWPILAQISHFYHIYGQLYYQQPDLIGAPIPPITNAYYNNQPQGDYLTAPQLGQIAEHITIKQNTITTNPISTHLLLTDADTNGEITINAGESLGDIAILGQNWQDNSLKLANLAEDTTIHFKSYRHITLQHAGELYNILQGDEIITQIDVGHGHLEPNDDDGLIYHNEFILRAVANPLATPIIPTAPTPNNQIYPQNGHVDFAQTNQPAYFQWLGADDIIDNLQAGDEIRIDNSIIPATAHFFTTNEFDQHLQYFNNGMNTQTNLKIPNINGQLHAMNDGTQWHLTLNNPAQLYYDGNKDDHNITLHGYYNQGQIFKDFVIYDAENDPVTIHNVQITGKNMQISNFNGDIVTASQLRQIAITPNDDSAQLECKLTLYDGVNNSQYNILWSYL